MCKQDFLRETFVIIASCCFILSVFIATNGNATTNYSINNEALFGKDTRDFKLTKYLNIEIGGGSKKHIDEDLRNSVISEIKTGIRNEVRGFSEALEDVQTPLENYSHTELITVLKELRSEVSTLKKEMLDIANHPSSECLIQSDILDGKSYPVGTSFHRLCQPNVLYKEETQTKISLPRSCKEVQEQGNNASGVYHIQPKTLEKPLMVLCDMETKGGGWTHIQKRYDGSVDFFLGWREYKFGFGDLASEFWIGLENIYRMIGFELNELLVEIVDRDNKAAYAHYKAFSIGSEAEGYKLDTLKNFSGDAGDSLTYHLGSKFSTKDFDQDNHSSNCAQSYSGAWWYKECHYSNLNGKYLNTVLPNQYKYQGMIWAAYRHYEYSHAKSRMMVRPVG